MNWAELQLEVEDLFTGAEFVYWLQHSAEISLCFATDVVTEQVVEEGSVSKTGRIVIPSLKTRTAKEWFEFAFDHRVYGKTTTAAGVGRLFSISSFILSSKRLSVTDENFKNQVFANCSGDLLYICSRQRKTDHQ